MLMRNLSAPWFSCCLPALGSGAAQSASTRLPEPVARALAQAGIPESGAGVYVHEIGAERPVISHGAERPFNPASTMKLVTTYAALDMLGPAYVWNTEVYSTGTLRDGVLNGDLVLKGAGDPKLTLEDFWLLLRESARPRRARDPRRPSARPHGFLDATGYDPARFDDQPTRPYNTGPDALLVNFKAVTLLFVPDRDARTVTILTEPPLPQVQVVNNLTLTNGACGDWVAKLKLDAQGNGDAARLAFNGSYSGDCGEKTRSFSVLGHRQYSGRTVRPAVEGTWRHVYRQRALRRSAGRRAAADERKIAVAVGDRAQHQQVQQQRDGAPVVPDAGLRSGRNRRRPSTRPTRASGSGCQARACRFRSW